MKSEVNFRDFTQPLIGMELSHIWRGYGSAIFLNFGELHHHIWKLGQLSNNPTGEMSLSLTWSWRIEGLKRIWCGSWSEEDQWQRLFDKMIGAKVKAVTTFARLPEIDLELSCGVHVVSFMTANGDPKWWLHDERSGHGRWLHVTAGRLQLGESTTDFARVRACDICMLPPYKSGQGVNVPVSLVAATEDNEPEQRENDRAGDADGDEGWLGCRRGG